MFQIKQKNKINIFSDYREYYWKCLIIFLKRIIEHFTIRFIGVDIQSLEPFSTFIKAKLKISNNHEYGIFAGDKFYGFWQFIQTKFKKIFSFLMISFRRILVYVLVRHRP